MHEYGPSDEILRARAIQVDTSQCQEIDLGLVWRELVNGQSRVIDSFHSVERCYLVLEALAESAEKMRRTQAGKIRILESILLDGAQKNVAMDLGLSPSTVAGALKQCLEQLGLPCTTSRISPLLVGAAYASQAGLNRRWGRVSQLSGPGRSYRVVSVSRPEVELARLLTPAQYEVVRLLMEGKSHEEIAISRRRSARTIANQLGAAFCTLGVSGRLELIRRLIAPPASAALGHGVDGAAPASSGREAPISVRRYRARARRVGARASM